jgi:hypothetical protein
MSSENSYSGRPSPPMFETAVLCWTVVLQVLHVCNLSVIVVRLVQSAILIHALYIYYMYNA